MAIVEEVIEVDGYRYAICIYSDWSVFISRINLYEGYRGFGFPSCDGEICWQEASPYFDFSEKMEMSPIVKKRAAEMLRRCWQMRLFL
jgi:hypothetical protein